MMLKTLLSEMIKYSSLVIGKNGGKKERNLCIFTLNLLFSFKDTHHPSREWHLTLGPNKGSSVWWKCKGIQWNPHDSSKYTYTIGTV